MMSVGLHFYNDSFPIHVIHQGVSDFLGDILASMAARFVEVPLRMTIAVTQGLRTEPAKTDRSGSYE